MFFLLLSVWISPFFHVNQNKSAIQKQDYMYMVITLTCAACVNVNALESESALLMFL